MQLLSKYSIKKKEQFCVLVFYLKCKKKKNSNKNCKRIRFL